MTLSEIFEYMLAGVPDDYDISAGSFFMTYFTRSQNRYISFNRKFRIYRLTRLL